MESQFRRTYHHAAAVLVPLVEKEGETFLLFERRALTIDAQPGEVSFPGGMHEGDEAIEETAVRETAEELQIDRAQIELLGEMDPIVGVGRAVYPFVGRINHYEGTFSKEEVDHVFLVPLSFLKEYQPRTSYTTTFIEPAENFPFELIEGGRDYPWHAGRTEMYFYEYEGEIIWGLTARILHAFLELV